MRMKSIFLFFWTLVLPVVIKSFPEVRKSFPVNPVVQKHSAAYFRKLDDVVVYEATAKMVFAVKLPTMEVYHLKVESKQVLESIQETTRMLRDEFKDYLKGFEETKKREKRQAMVLAGAAGGFLLHSIYSTFTRKSTGTNEEALHYIKQLQDSLRAHKHEYLFFHKEVESFSNKFSVFFEKFKKAETESEYLDLALLHLNQIEIAMAKVERGMDRCSNHLIPTQLIDTKTLQNHIKVLQSGISNTSYTLAIDPKNIGDLLKLKIADCYATNSTIYVLVNVPLRKSDWRIHQLIPIPFAFKNQTCSLSSLAPEVVAVTREHVRVIDASMMEFCDFRHDKLCLIPEFSHPSSSTAACVASLYHGSTVADVSSQCKFQCITTTELAIVQVEKDTIIAVNAEKVSVKCPEKYYDYNVDSIGSVSIRMKFHCSYEVRDYPLESTSVCISEMFRNEDVIHLFPNFLNITEHEIRTSSNYKWPANISVLNYTLPDTQVLDVRNEEILHYRDWWLMTVSASVAVIFCILLWAFCYIRNLK